ncbi:MAG TPA: hypothetical protein PK268_02020 [Enterococcus sp.]|mgnify:CR=1 FL=1|nr:hypothetical protein [Enterococcus sp.]HPR80680.1 hypothetical protein [Enterococcus sp.]
MRWLVKQRMAMYRYVMILYAVALNILFYTSGNRWIMEVVTLASIFAILAILGFSFHEKIRRIEREERRQQRKEQRKKESRRKNKIIKFSENIASKILTFH